MDTNIKFLVVVVSLFALIARADETIPSGQTFTISSGATATFAPGSTANFTGSTVNGLAGGLASVPISNSIWVDAAGNDGTCVKGDLTKPCASIATAASKVVAGDVIYVGPRVAPFDQGTTPLPIPAGVSLVGSGIDFTTITSAVSRAATNRAGVEPVGVGAAVSNMTIINTAADSIAFGAGSSTPSFTSAYLSNCKVIGTIYGVRMQVTGAALQMDNTVVTNTGDAVTSNGVGNTVDMRNCNLISNAGGTATPARGIVAGLGAIIRAYATTITAGNSTASNIGVDITGATTVVELHGIPLSVAAGGTSFDLRQTTTSKILYENVTRVDGAPLNNSGSNIVQLSRYAVRDYNLNDLVDVNQALANLGGQPANPNLDDISALSLGTNAGKAIVVNGTEDGLILGTVAAGGGTATKLDVADADTTITGTPTVINLTTPFTASHIITLPAANTYSTLLPLVIEDPRAVESGTFTLSVRRAGGDTINGGSGDVVVLGATEAGGSVIVMSDGVSKWTTISKGGGSRFAKNDADAYLLVKPACAVVAVANVTLSGEQTIDGQLTASSLVLATAQTTGSQNGPWVSGSGAWTRPTWYPSGSTRQAPQFCHTQIRLGTTYVGSWWRMTTSGVTIDTTATTWTQIPVSLAATGVTGTLASANIAPTLTGKRIDPRVTTIASNATLSPNTDTDDVYAVSALAVPITLISAPTGTPHDSQKLEIRVISASVQPISGWDTIYRFSTGNPVPTTTVASSTHRWGFEWNPTLSKWDCIAQAVNP